MTNLVAKVSWCAAAVVLVSGCAEGTSQDSAGTTDGSASSVTVASGTAAAPGTSTSSAASHCALATPEALKTATQLRYGPAIGEPFTIDTILCSGDWARVGIPMTPSYPQNTMALLHFIGNRWSAVQYGSGFNCEPEGVPAADAAVLGC